jgi:hypothetical protein
MAIEGDEGILRLTGSIGDTLEVGTRDTDGEICFSIFDGHYAITASAWLGDAEREALIDWLRGGPSD